MRVWFAGTLELVVQFQVLSQVGDVQSEWSIESKRSPTFERCLLFVSPVAACAGPLPLGRTCVWQQDTATGP